MLYKPNYCCDCGEKIERVEWRFWTNRRFCEICETEHKLDDWLKRVFPVLFLVIGVFGLGGSFSGTESVSKFSKTEKKLSLRSVAEVAPKEGRKVKSPEMRKKNAFKSESQISEKGRVERGAQLNVINRSSPADKELQRVVKVKSRQKDTKETVYFCGAKTKKGSPCSRKVKGGGRCWQHEGREAILTAKELLVVSN